MQKPSSMDSNRVRYFSSLARSAASACLRSAMLTSIVHVPSPRLWPAKSIQVREPSLWRYSLIRADAAGVGELLHLLQTDGPIPAESRAASPTRGAPLPGGCNPSYPGRHRWHRRRCRSYRRRAHRRRRFRARERIAARWRIWLPRPVCGRGCRWRSRTSERFHRWRDGGRVRRRTRSGGRCRLQRAGGTRVERQRPLFWA